LIGRLSREDSIGIAPFDSLVVRAIESLESCGTLRSPEAESLWSGPGRSAWQGSQGGGAPLATQLDNNNDDSLFPVEGRLV
jgi:hypothetical protein